MLGSEPSMTLPDAPLSPRWQLATPSGQREQLSLDELVRRHQQKSLAPGTLVCAPGQTKWRSPSQHPEFAGQLLGAPPRDEQPTFNDETVALGAAEAEALKLQSQSHWPEPTPPRGTAALAASRAPSQGLQAQGLQAQESPTVDRSAGERATPDNAASAPSSSQQKLSEGQLFDDEDVDEAMHSFDNILSEPPSRDRASPSSEPPLPAPTEGEDTPGSGPALPAPQGETSMPAEASPPVPPAPTMPPPRPVDVQSSVPAEGVPLPPLPAPKSSLPKTPAPPPSRRRPSDFRASSIPDEQLSAPEWEEDSGPVILDSALSGSGVSAPPDKSRSPRLWVLLALLLLLASGGVGLSVFRPALFQQGVRAIESMVGQSGKTTPTDLGEGPPFNTPAASRRLGEVAQSLAPCSEPTGPTGQGRARVLFAPTGRARSVALDAPYANTAVGACIEKMFLDVRVPAFGGQPVRVNKSFALSR